MTAPILIATAGHVDHGKSTLVQTLTGIDPDRWAIEKQRGITIDLGYAHVEHAGRTYSFVDVPGHERFIHNMLAGIGSIDGVLFVIAADESIMPQTREHALALQWLGVAQVHVAITKVDLVDADIMELLELEIDEFLEEHGWGEAKKLFFSSKKPETVMDVLDLLARFEKREPSRASGFRLSIDRVFTSEGTGTVVTGTVDRGRLSTDDTILIQPTGLEGRIRQLQLHGQTVADVGAHTRVAINPGNIHYKEIRRGHCVYGRVAPELTRKVLVRFTAFDPDWKPSPKHQFHVHHLAADLLARMLWREDDVAALELRDRHGFWALDRGLIRDGSPLEIRAGFEILDPDLRRSKRRQVVPTLGALPAEGDHADWQRWHLARQQEAFELARVTRLCGEPLIEEQAETLVTLSGGLAMRKALWEQAIAEMGKVLSSLHQRAPLFDYLPHHEVNAGIRALGWPDALRETVLTEARQRGLMEVDRGRVRRKNWHPRWSPEDRRRLKTFLSKEGKHGIIDLRDLGTEREKLTDIEKLLLFENHLIALTPDLLIHHRVLTEICAEIAEAFQSFSIPELKDRFGFTRKIALPLLEYLDKSGLTRREGDARVWIARQQPVFESRWQPPER